MEIQKIIPHFFYDLISRIIPGGIAFIGISRAIGHSPGETLHFLFDGAAALQGSGLFLATSFLLFSFLIGHLLAPLSYLFEVYIVDKIFRRPTQVLANALGSNDTICPPRMKNFILNEMGCDCEIKLANELKKYHSTEIFVLFDWLQIYRPDVGARLAKHRAEYRMFSSISVAALLSISLHLSCVLRGFPVPLEFNNGVYIAIAVLIVSLFGTVRTKYIFQWEVIHYYYVAKGRRDTLNKIENGKSELSQEIEPQSSL